jgi:hypothetical protein
LFAAYPSKKLSTSGLKALRSSENLEIAIELLKTSSTLEYITIEIWKKIDFEKFQDSLTERFRKCSSLRNLNLRRCKISNGFIAFLSSCLVHLPSPLEKLEISFEEENDDDDSSNGRRRRQLQGPGQRLGISHVTR